MASQNITPFQNKSCEKCPFNYRPSKVRKSAHSGSSTSLHVHINTLRFMYSRFHKFSNCRIHYSRKNKTVSHLWSGIFMVKTGDMLCMSTRALVRHTRHSSLFWYSPNPPSARRTSSNLTFGASSSLRSAICFHDYLLRSCRP